MGVNDPMRITLGWARCADNVADVLRRGAWYPVVEESGDGHVVVEVRGCCDRPWEGRGWRSSPPTPCARCAITARTSPASRTGCAACAAARPRRWTGRRPADV